ncbi:MAG TPA: elongation factor P maturation arginine rhamnosyltransferase EarP [Burkholderiales bacterium]|nr:elongation factor P maturation arginine rhamnosyltransferase EarP [Burkholderiales bacterium]
MSTPYTWDIFCRVVDNFGDAAVCWRLARQLALEHGDRVRLWIDDVSPLERLNPEISAAREAQEVDTVAIRRWTGPLDAAMPAQVVVEAFGGGLPEPYVAAMAAAAQRPLWLVLEYLSAEAWVPAHHGRPSPPPRVALERYYFFPGFVEGTGGLLRERELFARRDRFDDAASAALWRTLGHEPPGPGSTTVSVFSYESAPLRELLECWSGGPAPTVVALPEGRALPLALDYFGAGDPAPGRVLRRGALEVRVVPFMPQALYDELLWACDINFVRGEDSFVRAQWAARPFVWQAYPQPEGAHVAKLEAFMQAYSTGLPSGPRDAVWDMSRIWNQIAAPGVTPASAWRALQASQGLLRQHGAAWAERLASLGDLAGNLRCFWRRKVKNG